MTYTTELDWYDDDACSVEVDATSPEAQLKLDELANLLDQAVTDIEQSGAEKARIASIVTDLALYTGQPISDVTYPDLAAYDHASDLDTVNYNITYSCCSTILAQVASFRPRCLFIPDAGNYKTNRVCRDMTAASDAWAKREHYQEEASMALLDALRFPGGCLKIYLDDEAVCLMRVPPWELLVDEEDGRNGRPECIYHVRYVTLRQALRMYGDTDAARAKIVEGASHLSNSAGYNRIATRQGKQMVRVVDAYRRGPGGRNVILVGNYVAKNEVWEHDGHPFEIVRFDKKAQGFWGTSAIQPIRTLQYQVNDALDSMGEASRLTAKMFIALNGTASSDNSPEKLTNEAVQIFKSGASGSIQFHNPAPFAPGFIQWVSFLEDRAFKVLGVSPNAAHALKAPAVTSGKAIQAVTEIENDRRSQLSQVWEQLVVRVGDWWFRLSSDLEGGGGEYQAVDRGRARTIKFQKGDRKPTIDTFPSSLFGNSISARLQGALDAIKAGFISREQAMQELDLPGSGFTDQELAEFWHIERFMDDLLEGVTEYETPDPWVDPVKFFEYARRRYLLALDNGNYPETGITNARKLLDYLQPVAEAARQKAKGGTPPQEAQANLPPAGPSPALLAAAAPPVQVAPPLPGLVQTPEAPIAA